MTEVSARAAQPVPDISPLAKATFGLAVLVNLYAVVGVVSGRQASIAVVADGPFAPGVSLLTPGQPAFALWGLIYLGSFGHAVRVWLPDQAVHGRRHRVILPAIGTAALNTVWIICALRGYVAATVLVSLAMLLLAWAAMEGLRTVPAEDPSSLVLMDGTYGLYVGWLLVAVPANLMVVATRGGWLPDGPWRVALALGLLLVATVAALVAVRRFAGNIAVLVAFCWGLAWLARARAHEGPAASYVAWAATAAAALVVASFVMGSPGLPERFKRATTTVTPVTSPAAP